MADLSFWVGAGDYGAGNAHGAQVYGSAWESGTSVDGNYSTVSWSISATYTCKSGYTWGGTTRPTAGYLDMIINGSVVGTLTMSITHGWGNGASIGSLSGSLNIGHAADGTGSFSFQLRVRTGDSFSGDQAVYGSGSQSSSKGLSTIPRASQPSASTGDPTVGSAFTVYTNRKSSSFTHTIYYEVRYGGNNGAHVQVASGVAGSCTVTVPMSVFDSIGSSSTVPLRILCYTYSGSTQIGDVKYTDLTLHASSSMAPSISSFAVTETNSSVSAKGSSITLRYLSRKVATCKASAKNGASIASVIVTNGSSSWAMPLTLSTYTSATMDMLASGHYVVTVTDSRGLKSQAEINQTYYSYSAPTVSGSASRASATGANGTLTLKGAYWNGLSNTATITYKRNDTSAASTLSATASNGSVSGSVAYTDLDYQTVYRWTLTITDSFGESGSVTVTLTASVPSFWIGKTTIAINGVKLIDIIHPIGSIITTVSSTNPGSLPGYEGTKWEEITGRFLLAHDESHPAASTGGEFDHTLTVDEMPSHSHKLQQEGHNPGTTDGASKAGSYPAEIHPDHDKNWYLGTQSVGGSKAHNNTPPYLAVYMWKRTS